MTILIKCLVPSFKELSRHDAFTLPTLCNLILDAYTLKPKVMHLREVYDFKRCALGIEDDRNKVFAQLHNISFNHMFLVQWDETIQYVLLYAKHYSSSSK